MELETLLDLIMTAATIIAVAIAAVAAAISWKTVRRSKLDYLAIRADYANDALASYSSALDEYNAVLMPYWSSEGAPKEQIEKVHRSKHLIETSSRSLISAIDSLYWSMPERVSVNDVERLKNWVSYTTTAIMPMYFALVSDDWGNGPIRTEVLQEVEAEFQNVDTQTFEIVKRRIRHNVALGHDAAQLTTDLVEALGLECLVDNFSRLALIAYRQAGESTLKGEGREPLKFWSDPVFAEVSERQSVTVPLCQPRCESPLGWHGGRQ